MADTGTPRKDVTIVVPMGGFGERFATAGYDVPKPFVPVSGRAILDWSILGCERSYAISRLILITRRELIEPLGRFVSSRSWSHQVDIVELPGPTIGAAQTLEIGLETVGWGDVGGEIVVADCDVLVECDPVTITEAASTFVVVTPSKNPAHCFVKTDGARVISLHEKDHVSNVAIAGHYGFSSAERLRALIDVSRPAAVTTREWYVSDVVRCAISSEGLQAVRASTWIPLGTPEEVTANASRLRS